MDVSYGEQAERYRGEIRGFLAEHLPADWAGAHRLSDDERDRWIDQWRALLSERGLLAPAWPAEYGGGGLSHQEVDALGAQLFIFNRKKIITHISVAFLISNY